MLPVFSDRRTDWPSHPHATRDSLHEHDMWVAEGLTHRYPTKVLAELLPTCPQYCGHCTRMDLVGNSTPVIDKLKFDLKPVDRYDAMIDYLRRSPGVRDVVVSGGDVANMPFKNLEAFVARLLDIENIRDIRLATKALMGLPQHWLQDDVRAGMERLATVARARGVHLAIHTHVNNANSVTPLVADATKAMLEAGVRDVRNQGVLMHGVNATTTDLLDLCFSLLDGAGIMPYYFYMCDMIPFSEHWRVSVDEAQKLQHGIMGYLPGFATPRIICDVPFVGKRWVHQIEEYDHERGISYWTKNYRTGIEKTDPEALSAALRVLRPDPHPARGRPGVVAGARPRGRPRRGSRPGRGASGRGVAQAAAPAGLTPDALPGAERLARCQASVAAWSVMSTVAGASGGVGLVAGPQPLGQPDDHLAHERGAVLERRPEPAPADDHQLDRGRGDDRRVAGGRVDHGQLAEPVARPERGDLGAAALHRQLALDDQPELLARAALADHRVARRVAQVVGLPDHHVQLLLRHPGEEGHRLEAGDVQVLGHPTGAPSRESEVTGPPRRPGVNQNGDMSG